MTPLTAKRFSHRSPAFLVVLCVVLSAPVRAEDAPKPFAVPVEIRSLMTTGCGKCHEEGGRGNVRLDNLESLKPAERLDTLNKVQDQLFFGMMPPPKSEALSAKDTKLLAEWVRAELRMHKASKLDDRLPYPDAGNYVDHATLFNGSVKEKPFTPARRWLVSPQIFQERVMDVFQLEGKERENFRRQGFHGVTNPFLLPDHAGVRYYDLQTLDGSHLLAMMTNAEWIASKQLQAARVKAGDPEALPKDPKDKWAPKSTPLAFETIVMRKGDLIDDEIRSAVEMQFHLVLRRKPTSPEAEQYVELTKKAIQATGNTEGLRQMMKAVLLESEFVYRLEFGEGQSDDAGRVMLAPREAAYALAYALGDRGPDPALLKAAESGKLTTRSDYEREVRRLLAEKTHFAAVTDQSLGQVPSTTTSHPRLLRFFREFFGYHTAHKVFKDIKRADGIYGNADRGSTGTAGRLISEADRVLIDILDADKAVFETMLTTDKFFFLPPQDESKAKQQIEKWRAAYEVLKTTNWKKDPEGVAKEHDALIKKYLNPKGLPGKHKVNHDDSILRIMPFFDATFGKGLTPYTATPWQFGNGGSWYATIYNLGNMPGRGGKYEPGQTFSYEPVQPFHIDHRMGILTHPAWLIAFGANTASDPIRRGRWIREKLLAGVVPDVPITVDAKVPDDPHQTLRERVAGVTGAASCIKCHSRMNDLGYPLEQFDDFGRFRTVEKLEHPDNLLKDGGKSGEDEYKTKPVDSAGFLSGTGDPKLDGPVKDSFELISRLAKSERVRQSIIRHAFRYFLGRNELPSDSKTLIEADLAYLKSGGSFNAVVLSLLTSDSFIYRKPQGTP